MKLSSFTRAVRRVLHAKNAQGVALPMVLIVFVVGVALVSAFLVAIVGSATVTSSNKDLVRAQAAAEAGIAAAEVAMLDDPCNTRLDQIDAPDAADFSFPTVTPICTGASDADRQVKLTVSGTSAGTTATVEALYDWVSYAASPPRRGMNIVYLGGVGMAGGQNYLTLIDDYGVSRFDVRPNTVTNTTTDSPFTCRVNRDNTVPTDLRLDVSLTISGGKCIIDGDLYLGKSLVANSSTTLNVSGDILGYFQGGGGATAVQFGNVTAANLFSNSPISTGSGSVVTGQVLINSPHTSTLQGNLSQVISQGSVSIPAGGQFVGSLKVNGNVVLSKNAKVTGSITATGTVTLESGARVIGDILGATNVTVASGTPSTSGFSNNRNVTIASDGAVVEGDVIAAQSVTVGTPYTAQHARGSVHATGGGMIQGEVHAGTSVTVHRVLNVKTNTAVVEDIIRARGAVVLGEDVPVKAPVYSATSVTLNGSNPVFQIAGCIIHAPNGKIEWKTPTPVALVTALLTCGPDQQSPRAVSSVPATSPVQQLTIPAWRDYSHTPADIELLKDLGYGVPVMNRNICATWEDTRNGGTAWSALSSISQPMVYDLRVCGAKQFGKSSSPALNVKLPYDVVLLVSNGSEITNINFDKHANAEADPQISIIHPVNRADRNNQHYCSGGSSDLDIKGVKTTPSVGMLIYTPCELDFESSDIYGSVYAGMIEVNQPGTASTLRFRPVTLPTWYDAEVSPVGPGTGSGTGGGGTGVGAGSVGMLGELVYQRNVTNAE